MRRPVLRMRINNATSTSQKDAISCDFFSKVSFRLLSFWLRLLETWVILKRLFEGTYRLNGMTPYLYKYLEEYAKKGAFKIQNLIPRSLGAVLTWGS